MSGLLVTAAAAAGYALAGPAAVAVVTIVAAVGGLVVLPALIPPGQAGSAGRGASGSGLESLAAPVSFTGYWRRQSALADAKAAMGAYESRMRPTLEHLLASRLAERHGISLYDDPARARQVLCRDGGDDLWYWIDPARPPAETSSRAGIPPRTLARLIDRLENL